jgi:hypothetical protein
VLKARHNPNILKQDHNKTLVMKSEEIVFLGGIEEGISFNEKAR